MQPQDTPGWKFFEHHLTYFFNKDVDGLLASDYNDDAVVVSYDFAVKGKDNLKQLFTAYLEMMGDITIKSTEHFRETEDSIMVEATMDTSRAGERKVYDVFVMKNGKISYHFTGLRS
jgi:ketosteroid isomerase-like protein